LFWHFDKIGLISVVQNRLLTKGCQVTF